MVSACTVSAGKRLYERGMAETVYHFTPYSSQKRSNPTIPNNTKNKLNLFHWFCSELNDLPPHQVRFRYSRSNPVEIPLLLWTGKFPIFYLNFHHLSHAY